MKFRVEVVCISDAGQEHRSDVLVMERGWEPFAIFHQRLVLRLSLFSEF